MKILVAEDDSVSSLLLTTKLKKMGHEVIATEDGEAAWQAFLAECPQMVITDWMMPHVDGIELCRRIRLHWQAKYVYIIMLTALSGKQYYMEGMDAGADDYLNKPVDLDELQARLHVANRILTLRTEISRLNNLLPICAWCRKVRDDKGYWQELEAYVQREQHLSITHGICQDCAEEVFGHSENLSPAYENGAHVSSPG
ncbi:MAG: response regulator transcription factor [Ignavibacteria bacterium]|nr:response regulator transcription factor [Ignavibacteria bacterium]MBI3766581.1 response regulator transcription factor [Ignavibacteriales bacterium]